MHRAVLVLVSVAAVLPACKKEEPQVREKSAPVQASSVAAPARRPPASAPAPAPKPPRPANAIAETGAGVTGLTADATHVFWASNGFQGSTKGILSVSKKGGDATRLSQLAQAQGVWATNARLYFYDAGPELFTVPKSGGDRVSVLKDAALGAAAAGGDTFCWIGALERDSAQAGADAGPKNVLESDERSIFCRKDGADKAVRVADATLFTTNLLVAGNQVFWPTSESTIQAAPVRGGAERSVAREVNGVIALAANKRFIYFMGAYQKDQGLFVVPKAGGTPKRLAAIGALARHLVADDSNAYYASKGGLWRVSLSKEQEPELVDAIGTPAGLVADDASVFLADGFYLRRSKKR